MNELGITYNRPHRKSAYVVGEVMGKYHPHGDSAIYETIVRLAQDWMMRYPLADGPRELPARWIAIRPRLSATPRCGWRGSRATCWSISTRRRSTSSANYDETLTIPEVLPTRVPNLLVNGSSGIAVGMATNIPPHNMTEVINGCLALLDDPGASADDLMEHIQGPDFPDRGHHQWPGRHRARVPRGPRDASTCAPEPTSRMPVAARRPSWSPRSPTRSTRPDSSRRSRSW